MDVAELQQLFEYNSWANRRVWDCVATLDESQLDQEQPNGQSTIRQQCRHLLGVEYWWPHYLATGVIEFIQDVEMPTKADIRAAWDRVEEGIRAYLATATREELERRVSPEFWQGGMDVQAWQALVQVLHHSTDHRAQILGAVRSLGGPTVEQDFLGFLYESAQGRPRE